MSRKSEIAMVLGIGAGFGAVIGGCSGALAGEAIDKSINGAEAVYEGEPVNPEFLHLRGIEIANYPKVESAGLAVREDMKGLYGSGCIGSLVDRADSFAFNVPELDTKDTVSIVFKSPECAGKITDSDTIEDFGRFLPTEGYMKYFDFDNETIMFNNAAAALEQDNRHDGSKLGMLIGALMCAPLLSYAAVRKY
jgi:hypothetical protein